LLALRGAATRATAGSTPTGLGDVRLQRLAERLRVHLGQSISYVWPSRLNVTCCPSPPVMSSA